MSEVPKVLIIGDSISVHFTPPLQRLLVGRYEVVHHEGNAGDSSNTLRHLGAWVGTDGDAALIHFNCGLHDLRATGETEALQVRPQDYRRNLARIVERLKTTEAKLIWATITPVIDEWHGRNKGFIRRQKDVERYNRIALEIVREAGIAVNDLHDAVRQAGPQATICPDGVHMSEQGSEMLAAKVAEVIVSCMEGTG